MDEDSTPKPLELKLLLLVLSGLILTSLALCCVLASAQMASPSRILNGKTLPPATLNAEYDYDLRAEGGALPYRWTITGGHLPPGLQVQEDGKISGHAEVPGEYSFDVSLTDSSKQPSPVFQSFLLRVPRTGLAVVTSNPELPWGRIGSDYYARLTAAGSIPPFFWKAEGSLPAGVHLSTKGVLSGVPRESGDFSVPFQVYDLGGHTSHRTFSIHISSARMDRFGGVFKDEAKASATGSWHTTKLGDRWALLTPEGNPFWMIGMWDISSDEHKDELGASYDQRAKEKYGSEAVRWLQANRRLRSWGFNTVGPYSYRMMLPTDSEPEWSGSEQPVKMPFVWIARDPAITGRKQGIFKNLYAGLDSTVTALGDQGSANFPDVFDPAWVRNTFKLFADDDELMALTKSPFLIGIFGDDTDYVSGFGPGPEFTTQPPDKTHVHLGYLALIMAPTQLRTNDSNIAYVDTRVYTKFRLRDFLQTKYRTIAALNASWGATYTTFDADGDWPTGGGLLDENGRSIHRWLGSGDPALPPSGGANRNMVRDLDEFLFLMARQYLSTERDALRAIAPSTLFFGPTTIGGWWAPSRVPIYRAARESLDVISLSTDLSQGQLDFVERETGDVPLMIWEGVVANADSSQWRHTKRPGPATWFAATQAERAERYTDDLRRLFNARTKTGTHPFVGHLWWAWTDSLPEEKNWGAVSLMDNSYDGYEAGRTPGIDAWGFPTGGEEHNYGNFLGPVRTANFSLIEQFANEQH